MLCVGECKESIEVGVVIHWLAIHQRVRSVALVFPL